MSDSAASPAPSSAEDNLGDLLLEVLPPDGSTIGNGSAREGDHHDGCALFSRLVQRGELSAV